MREGDQLRSPIKTLSNVYTLYELISVNTELSVIAITCVMCISTGSAQVIKEDFIRPRMIADAAVSVMG